MNRKLALESLERREMLADVSFTAAAVDPVTHAILPLVGGAYEVAAAQRIEIQVFAQDVRENPTGVFAAYVDMFYDHDALTLDPATFHIGPTFVGFSHMCDFGGGIRYAGGTGGVNAPGSSPQLVFYVQATVTPGTWTETHIVLQAPVAGWFGTYASACYGANQSAVCEYHDAVLGTAVPAAGALRSANASWTNPTNRYDVTGDGQVNRADIVALIAALRVGGEGRLAQVESTTGNQVDVDGDGKLTKMDLLECQFAGWAQQAGLTTRAGRFLQGIADMLSSQEWWAPDVEVNPLKKAV